MKKMYNTPQTEVMHLNTERLMDGITLSGAGGDGPGSNEAPARRGDLIP